jgi:transcriptional regulator with XRE-family HTH domain
MSRPAVSSEAQRFGFATALRAYAARANLSQEQLRQRLAADGILVGQGTMSKWTLGKATPPNATVEAMEHHLDLVPGVLSRHLGWLPLTAVDLGTDAETAILADDRLTPDQREVLLATYRALVGIEPRAKPVRQLNKRK